MSPEEYITGLILNLSEVETLELAQVINIRGRNLPPFRRGEFDPAEVREWVAHHLDSIAANILRVVDLNDEAIAYLYRLRALRIGITPSVTKLKIKFSEVADSTKDLNYSNEPIVTLTDLAASSAALCELFVEIAAANHVLGIATLSPPEVRIQKGSIQYTVGGSLFASGVALVVACSAGLVIAPVGFIGGGVLASAGLIDLALGWKKAVTENRKIRAETIKLEAEAHKLEAEARKLDLEANQMEAKTYEGEIYQYKSFAHSKLVSRDVVLREAERLGLTEGYANYILNRALPKYGLILQRFRNITIERIDEG